MPRPNITRRHFFQDCGVGDERGEGDLTYADAAVLEEVAPGDVGAGGHDER